MSKNIIFCADGTWDSLKDTDKGLPAPTNISQFYHCLLNDGITQVAYYDDGIGADNSELSKLFEGATGAGLATKIMDGYQYIMNQWEEGDSVYLFGFSRGAYTVRCVADMIAQCGLLPKISGETLSKQREKILSIYLAYRKSTFNASSTWGNNNSCIINMIGVWDTVGALGIPLRMFSFLDHVFFNFHNTVLHKNVRFGYQALAIDEERVDFKPALWEKREGVEQVWFAGSHADVGGGYAEHGLSDIVLRWMMIKALFQGVHLIDSVLENGALKITGNPYSMQHFPWQALPFSFLPTAKRIIPQGSEIHESVQQRMLNISLQYNPVNLPNDKIFVTDTDVAFESD